MYDDYVSEYNLFIKFYIYKSNYNDEKNNCLITHRK